MLQALAVAALAFWLENSLLSLRFSSGVKAVWVYTADGEKYLDFSTGMGSQAPAQFLRWASSVSLLEGIGVTNLGHCHPHVTEAVRQQIGKLWHAQA